MTIPLLSSDGRRKEEALRAESEGWETATIGDGLASGNPHQDDDSSKSDRVAR
jgi:hypothetical protein